MRKVSYKKLQLLGKKLKISNFLLIFEKLWVYNRLLWIYNFYFDTKNPMKKLSFWRLMLIFTSSWATVILIQLSKQIPFNLREPVILGQIFLLVFLLGSALFAGYQYKKDKKLTSSIDSDEMSKKVGYTALALSFQLLTIGTGVVLLIDSFMPFLHTYTAKDAGTRLLVCWGILVFLSARYYTHNPDKTWL